MKKLNYLFFSLLTLISFTMINVNAEEYSDAYKKLTTDDTLEVKSITPKNEAEADYFITSYVNTFDNGPYTFYMAGCNEDYTVCNVRMGNLKDDSLSEEHELKITYSLANDDVAKVIEDVAKSITKPYFTINDLELINFLVNTGYTPDSIGTRFDNEAINYSSEIKETLGNPHVTAKIDLRQGGSDPFSSGGAGALILMYDGVIYKAIENGGIGRDQIIYIPDETPDTTKDYIAAAEKRISDYLKSEEVEITYAGAMGEYPEYDFESFVDVNKTLKEYYELSYNDYLYNFLIVKDSSKIKKEMVTETQDVETNIKITTTSPSVPLDTVIQVKPILATDEKFTEITKKLEVKEAVIYDLKLYSASVNEYISKLDDGTFSVTVPIPENLKGKDLIAYYIHDDGKIDEHDVTFDDEKKYVTFNTYHFSIYTIAEKKVNDTVVTPPVDENDKEDTTKEETNKNNPSTYDGISLYYTLGILSLIGIAGSVIVLKKVNN